MLQAFNFFYEYIFLWIALVPPCKQIYELESTKSTISIKVLSESVLLSNNSIWDMSCFLRASVLLSKEQSGTVDMANKYKLASILTIYMNHAMRTEEANTIRAVYSHSTWLRATKKGKIKSRMHESWWKSKVLYHEMTSEWMSEWMNEYSAVQSIKAAFAYL